ncbi:MAG: M6 family metalloprotease domain-containing protein [Thermoplasmata archaeon]|nr:MAG: M6 family metalloprotease domain-containing protein [Thermoplasmata archaeon]
MGSQTRSRSSIVVLVAMMTTLLVALPSGAALAALEDSAQETLAEERALAILDHLHSLPETVEYVPPAPWYAEQLEEEGYGHDFVEPDTNAILASDPAPMAETGTRKVPSLAIEFTDVKHDSRSTINALQNKITGGNSMKSYFDEVSYGKLTIDGSASGWYEAANDMAYYGKPEGGNHDSRKFYELVAEAVRAADPTVDFSQYDTNNDRIIDGVVLVHAGRDEATGGGQNTIWSKQSVYPYTLRVDGVYLGYYVTVSEYSPVGVYVHEFGHLLDLPDLYDTDYTSTGVGVWDVMGSGAWNDWGRTPSHPSAWSKMFLGWVDPTVINNYVEGYQVTNMAGDSPMIIKLPTEESSQFFLLENRQTSGYDRYLPGGGLLIWHIDTAVINQYKWSNRVNNNEARKGVDLEEASGTQDLDTRSSNDGDSSDPWKNNLNGFSSTSNPNSNLYDGTVTNIKVFNISASLPVMTIDIDFGGDSFKIFMDTISSLREAAPGQEILYNITVGTRSATGDILYISLRGTHASWGTLDAQYHTISLGPKGSRIVQIRVTPPAGTPKGVEGQVILHASSQTAAQTADLETITRVIQVHALTADPPDLQVHVKPGTPKTVAIKITNSGNGVENITLSLEAERGYWGSVNPSRISIGVLKEETVQVTFSVPEGVMAFEEEPFQLTLLSEVITAGETGQQITFMPTKTIDINMMVEEVVSLRWGNIPTESIVPGGTVPYELLLFNEGNSDVEVMMGYQAPEGWSLDFENGDNLTIPAFQVATVNATATAPLDAEAGITEHLELSVAKGVYFEFATIALRVEQLYLLEATGDTDMFADPGERAMFTVSVTNLGNGDDRVTMAVVGNGWETEVSPNLIDLGTDDVDRSREILVYMTPPDDAEAYDENTVTVAFTSSNGEVTAVHPITLNVNPVSSFQVDTEVVADLVDPGDNTKSRATYFVHVDNTGNLEDLFHIGLIGLPDGWTMDFDSRMLSVPANKRKMVEFSIMPPTGDSPAKAGTFNFKVHVASELGSSQPVESALAVKVASNRGHSVMPLEPSYTAPSGSKLTFRVLVTNEGNVPEMVSLSAVGEFESYSFEHLEISLEPFGQRVVNLTVELPSVTEDTELKVQVVVTTSDLSSQADVPVPILVEGRSGAPGPGAVAALLAVVVVAAVSLAISRRRLR